MSRRWVLIPLLALVFLGPAVRTDGRARTNEGHPVIIVNPTNGLPPGWTWEA